jgi:hypothetical protein
MTLDKILSSRMKESRPFTEEEIQLVLAEGDHGQLMSAAILCKDHAHYQRIKARLVELGAKL